MADSVHEKDRAPLLWSSRLALTVLCCLGFVNMFVLRGNISVGIVCMVNHTAGDVQRVTHSNSQNTTSNLSRGKSKSDSCLENTNDTTTFEDGEFEWNKRVQALIHGSFYWGYIVTQVPGGYIAARFGGKQVIGWFSLLCAVATLFMPVAARISYTFLIVLRVVAGFGQGVLWPAMYAMWAYWIPPSERSRLVGISLAGIPIGNSLIFPISGVLCENNGWPTIFYVTGGFGVLWFIAWMIITAATPEEHPRISDREKIYIQNSLIKLTEKSIDIKLKLPWRSWATSLPFLAIVAMNSCHDWIQYTFHSNMPTYIHEVFNFDIRSNASLSAIPFICAWVVIVISGNIADAMLRRSVNTTVVRKLLTGVGGTVAASMCIGLGFINCRNPALAIVCLSLAVAFMGCMSGGGVLVNVADIAPKYSSFLFGVSNSIATLTGFLAPFAVGEMTTNQTQEEWRHVFFLSASIIVFGIVVYSMFASGYIQEWAKVDNKPSNITITITREDEAMTDGRFSYRPQILFECFLDEFCS